MRRQVQAPFFVFNPKSYMYGSDLIDLAKQADKLAGQLDMTIFVTGPYERLGQMAAETQNIIVTAQHMDGLDPGRGMGWVIGESLYDIGVRATFLNHAEHPMDLTEIVVALKKAKDLGIITIVCANSLDEATRLASLDPDIILCERPDLIGSGQTSDEVFIKSTSQAIKAINPAILVMQAAGVSKPADVKRLIDLGADGTGATSAIVQAEAPAEVLEGLILATDQAYKKA